MSEDTEALKRLVYFPGRRVRLRHLDGDAEPPAAFGLILKAIDQPDQSLRFLIEYERLDAVGAVEIDVSLFDLTSIEPVAIDAEQLRKDLIGRTVNFPWKSGIGIEFPKDAEQSGVIVAVRFEGGAPELGVRLPLKAGGETTLNADFSHCDLLPKSDKKDAPDP